MLDFDAIAIGGGLAGSAFALEASRRDMRVALVERTTEPHQKVCGDFHSREAQDLLANLGLPLPQRGATAISTFRLVSGKRSAEVPLPFEAAGYSRCRLDEALMEMAASAGAEVIRGHAATGLDVGDGHATVRIGARSISARSVALATGKHNLRGYSRDRGPLTAFKIPLEPTPAGKSLVDGVVQLAAYHGGYAGACTVEDGSVPLCWLADARLMSETSGDWRRQLETISRRSPLFGALVDGGKFLMPSPAAVSAIPFGYMRHDVIAPNVFAVGDQIAVIPSLTGDGTSLAVASGLRAARAVAAGKTAVDYQKEIIAPLRTQFAFARAMHGALSNGFTRNIAVESFKIAPRLASVAVNLTRARNIDALIDSDAAETPSQVENDKVG
jgi:flavin-dependent dehydrogenase